MYVFQVPWILAEGHQLFPWTPSQKELAEYILFWSQWQVLEDFEYILQVCTVSFIFWNPWLTIWQIGSPQSPTAYVQWDSTLPWECYSMLWVIHVSMENIGDETLLDKIVDKCQIGGGYAPL